MAATGATAALLEDLGRPWKMTPWGHGVGRTWAAHDETLPRVQVACAEELGSEHCKSVEGEFES